MQRCVFFTSGLSRRLRRDSRALRAVRRQIAFRERQRGSTIMNKSPKAMRPDKQHYRNQRRRERDVRRDNACPY
jgi:hypothetical protein